MSNKQEDLQNDLNVAHAVIEQYKVKIAELIEKLDKLEAEVESYKTHANYQKGKYDALLEVTLKKEGR
jgi:lysyl-tRNA synthetase class I